MPKQREIKVWVLAQGNRLLIDGHPAFDAQERAERYRQIAYGPKYRVQEATLTIPAKPKRKGK